MALIKCIECGKEISDRASACIHCGCPVDDSLKIKLQKSSSTQVVAIEPQTAKESRLLAEDIVAIFKSMNKPLTIDQLLEQIPADKRPTTAQLKDTLTAMCSADYLRVRFDGIVKYSLPLSYEETNNSDIIDVKKFEKNTPSENAQTKKSPEHIYQSSTETKSVKCPKCGSTQIQMVPRKWSLVTGFMTNKVDRICVSCKTKF